tara:strand:- start:3465 stop:9263 length:5799 start_codon:yes stop_codon:yes gene_type:complete
VADENTILSLWYRDREDAADVLNETATESDRAPVTKPLGVGETFVSGARGGAAQFEGDLDRFGALGNLLFNNKEAAKSNLIKAEMQDRAASAEAERIDDWETYVNDPSLEGTWDQAVVNVGRFTPMAITSIAGGGAGFVGGLLAKYGVKQAGVAASKEITEELLRKKIAGATLDEAEDALLKSTIAAAKLPKYGAVAGAFGQSYVVGSSQSLQEYQEAGIELTKDEAAMAALLGIPQAALDTMGEVFFAKTLFKQAVKRTTLGQTLNKARKGQKLTVEQQKLLRLYEKRASGAKLSEAEMLTLRNSSGAGMYVGELAKDLAKGFGRSAIVEGTTETAQEGLQIAQRFAIDDDYTAAMAKLRIGEAAFAGTVAGGARGGAAGTIAGIFKGAKDQVEAGFERKYRADARKEQYGDGIDVIPETQEQLDAQAEAVLDPGIDKDAVWVPKRSDGKEDLIPTFAGRDDIIAISTPTGTLYTTNKDKAELFDKSSTSGPSEEQLRAALGYTAIKNESHDRVVRIRNKNGQIVFEQSTNQEGLAAAVRNANRKIKDKNVGYVVEKEMLEQAVRERNMDMGDETSEMLDAEADDAGMQNVTTTEADVTQTEGLELNEAEGGAFDYVRNEDGEVVLYKATGKASEENKQSYLDSLTTEEQAYWTTRNQDGSRRIDTLSDGVIKAYLREVEGPADVFLSDAVQPGFYAIGKSGTAEATLDAAGILQKAKTKAKQTAFKGFKIDGWQLREEDGTTSDINIQDLVIAGRTISEQGDSDASFGQQVARGFGALLTELNAEGSQLLFKGVPVNEQIMSTAPVFVQGGRQLTLRQLNNLPKTAPRQESAADIQAALENEGFGLNEKTLIASAKSRYPELANLTDEDIKADPRYFDALENIAFEQGVDTAAVRSGVVDRGVEEADPRGEQQAMMSQPLEASGPATEKVNASRLDLEEGEGWYDSRRALNDPNYAQAAKGPTQINKGVSYSARAAEIFTDKGDNLLRNLKNTIEKNFGFSRKVKIITADDTATFTFNKETTYVDDNGNPIDPNNFIRAKQQQMKTSGRRGKIVTFGDTDVIILNIPTNSRGQPSSQDLYTGVLAVGHELGHSLFVQEINKLVNTPNLWKVLNKEFEKAQDQVGAPYTGEYGFEEWYADQMALFLLNEGKKPGNGSEAYFKRLANKIRKFFNSLHKTIQARFGRGVNPEFNNYAQQVIQSYREGRNPEEQPLETLTKVRIRNMADAVTKFAEKSIGKKNANKLNAEAKRILAGVENNIPENMRHWNIKWLVAPAHNYLTKVGGEQLANIFYSRSQSTDKTGHLNYRILVINRYLNTFVDLVDSKKPGAPTKAEMAEFNKVLLEAEQEGVNTEDLSPKAQEVRKWLDTFFDTYVSPNNPNIKKRKNFFSRQLNLNAVENNPQVRSALVNVLKAYNPKVSDSLLNKVVEDLIRKEESSDLDVDESGSDLAIGMGIERAKLFTNIPNEALRRGVDAQGNINPEGDTEILISPDQAIRKYVEDMVKRTDYNNKARATIQQSDLSKLKGIKGFETVKVGDEVTGWRAVETLLQRIDDPTDQQGARDAVKAMLGKTGLGMKPWQRNLNSWGLFLNVVTYLTFAVLASLPDLAGPVLRSKEFAGLGVGVNQLQHYFTNRAEMQQFARDVGVTTFDSLATMYVNASEMNFMTEKAKLFTDGFFRVTGTEAFTKFTRTFALGMGEQFLLTHANRAKNGDKTSIRYLNELNVKADDVITWATKERKTGKQGTRRSFNTPEGQKVQDALGRFVDESIIRPNAAERPVWASNPYTALIWQLKSFFYAYGKNIIGGAMRETQNKYAETGELGMAAVPLVIGAITLLPLTMVGLEIREFMKYLFGGFDETKLATNRMDYGEYSYEIFDRSGVLGPYGLLVPMFEAGNYGDEFWVSPLGPTAERIEDILKGDFRTKKYVPFYAAF